jgi:hypothetical protein
MAPDTGRGERFPHGPLLPIVYFSDFRGCVVIFQIRMDPKYFRLNGQKILARPMPIRSLKTP